MFFYDFYYFYASSIILLNGGNVYDSAVITATLHELGWPREEIGLQMFYPPWVLFLFLPLSLLPFQVALFIWSALILVSFLYIFRIWASLLEKLAYKGEFLIPSAFENPSLGGSGKKIFFYLTLFFAPFYKVFVYGQTSFLIILGVTLYIYYQCNSNGKLKLIISSLGLFLSSLKPQITLIFLIPALYHHIKKRDYTLLISLLLFFLTCTMIVLSCSQHIYIDFFESMKSLNEVSVHIQHPTLFNLFFKQLLPLWTFTLLQLFLSCIAAVFLPFTIKNCVLLYLPFSLLLSSFSWSHDFVILYPAYLILGATFHRTIQKQQDIWHSNTFFALRYNRFFLFLIMLICIMFLSCIPQKEVYTVAFSFAVTFLALCLYSKITIQQDYSQDFS
jgi:hypothetical protein